MLACGFAEGGEHDRAADPVVGGDVECVAGVVVEPGDDLDVAAERCLVGESVVGEVGLPGLVRHRCLEADVGATWVASSGWGDQALPGQGSGDRRGRDRDLVLVGEVPGDGVGAGVEAGLGELFAQLARSARRSVADRGR